MTTTDRAADRDRIRALVEGLAPGVPGLRGAIVLGEPHSQARPRVNKRAGTVYKLAADRDAEKATANELRGMVEEPLIGNLAVAMVFYRSTLIRCDLDNLVKHVWDACNKVLWADDSQITGLITELDLDRDNPRTVVAVCEHQSGMWRGPKGGSALQEALPLHD